MKTKYSETPTSQLKPLSHLGNAEACIELSSRNEKGYKTANTTSKYQALPNHALMSLANEDANACLELAKRFSDDSEKATYWEEKAKELLEITDNVNMEIMEEEEEYDWAITPDKNKHKYMIGIDFGHGEVSAAFCPIGWDTSNGELERVKDVDFGNNSKVIPSAISITHDDKAYIGETAFTPEILKVAQVHVCFKKRPTDINGEKEQLMIRFMREVYLRIREKSGAIFTNDNHLVYIATPSGWDKNDMNLYGQMAAQAGLPIAGITWESRAAFIKAQKDVTSGLPQYINQGAIVFDMGSSTLDFTYMYVDNGKNKRIDYGYDCGASQVEKEIYANIRSQNDELIEFEKKYPNLVDTLLFEARCAKEKVYCAPNLRYKKSVNLEDIIDDEDFEDTKMKFVFQPGELNQVLKEKGYIDSIRNAMIDFRDNKIGGKKICVAFLTGGASRMDFITELIEDCWHLQLELIYRDPDPSLTISQGIAEVGRIDCRGGKKYIAQVLQEINNQWDIYTPFTNLLIDKVTDKMTSTIDTCVTKFKDNDTDVSINDLQAFIGECIEDDVKKISNWAMECYQTVFEEKTKEVREKLDKIASDYSNIKIQMRETKLSVNNMPNIDLSVLNHQMQALSSSLMEDSSNLVQGIAGAAIGGAIAMLLGGPLAWLIGGGYLIGKFFFGEEKTEEQKRQEALAKDLDSDARQKVYDEFVNNWDNIRNKVHNSVEHSIRNNYELKRNINMQSKETILAYANECIAQTRLMVE